VPDVENSLYQWFLNERINYRVVNDEIRRIKSIEFNQCFNTGILFTASHG